VKQLECGTIITAKGHVAEPPAPWLVLERLDNSSLEVLALSAQQKTKHSPAIATLGPSADPAFPITPLFCDVSRRFQISLSGEEKILGTVSSSCKEEILRGLVKNEAERFYSAFHAPKLSKAFAPGDRIPYAGRVYDFEDMASLLDSSLDFWLTTGRFSEEFERAFAKFLGLRFSCLVNSGSSANLIAFAALTSPLLKDRQIQPGDEVITVAAGFPTTASPIIQYGCIPVFCDISVMDGTYNIDVSALESARSERTKAVMLAHTLGNPFNLKVVTEFCQRHNLWLVEDNCDALGSRYQGQLTGTFGDVATSSFYPPHHMTMGEGGAVYSKHLKLKRIIESFRDWGRDCWCAAGKDNTCGIRFDQQLGTLPRGYDHKYIYSHFGYNLKATDMQAAIGCTQLKKLPDFIKKRQQNWKFLREALTGLSDIFVLPEATANSEPSWFGFLLTIRPEVSSSAQAPTRDSFVRLLESLNIQTRMLFAGNLLRQPCFDEIRKDPKRYRVVGKLEQSDLVLTNTFWLGVYPGLTEDMLSAMVRGIYQAVGRKS
jgi:CDP-6-deoxy-D-xylo-4-hexulose-3-dehydrase